MPIASWAMSRVRPTRFEAPQEGRGDGGHQCAGWIPQQHLHFVLADLKRPVEVFRKLFEWPLVGKEAAKEVGALALADGRRRRA